MGWNNVQRQPQAPPAQPWAPATEKKILKGVDIAAGVLGFALMAGLWYGGALTTLISLDKMLPVIAGWGLWRWAIPAAFSVVEVVYSVISGRELPGWAKALFWLVGGFDLSSTFYGLYLWAPGRFIPLLTGFTIPSSGPVLLVGLTVLSLLLTFGPEKILIGLVKNLIAVVRS